MTSNTESNQVIIGTRGSALALWQANYTKDALTQAHPDIKVSLQIIKTKGDKILDQALSKIGDKGLFTKEIETALLDGDIDLAVHSHKDLPTQSPEGLVIGAVPPRANPSDVLITKGATSLDDLNQNATILTGSLRRAAQLKRLRPDIMCQDIRGNIQTRLEKFQQSDAQAFMMATAALDRLALAEMQTIELAPTTFIPACAQGALAIQVRQNDDRITKIIAPLNDTPTSITVSAERSFLAYLEGGCQAPIGAYCYFDKDQITLTGMVASLDGTQFICDTIKGNPSNARDLGTQLAKQLLASGANDILNNLNQ